MGWWGGHFKHTVIMIPCELFPWAIGTFPQDTQLFPTSPWVPYFPWSEVRFELCPVPAEVAAFESEWLAINHKTTMIKNNKHTSLFWSGITFTSNADEVLHCGNIGAVVFGSWGTGWGIWGIGWYDCCCCFGCCRSASIWSICCWVCKLLLSIKSKIKQN